MAELGEAEMAEGEAEFAVSAQETAEGEELAGAGLGLMMMGMAESAEAEGFRQEAERVAEESSTEPSAEAKTAS